MKEEINTDKLRKIIAELDEIKCGIEAPESQIELSEFMYSKLPIKVYELQKEFAALFGDELFDRDMSDLF
jgi:hypothetical protein